MHLFQQLCITCFITAYILQQFRQYMPADEVLIRMILHQPLKNSFTFFFLGQKSQVSGKNCAQLGLKIHFSFIHWVLTNSINHSLNGQTVSQKYQLFDICTNFVGVGKFRLYLAFLSLFFSAARPHPPHFRQLLQEEPNHLCTEDSRCESGFVCDSISGCQDRFTTVSPSSLWVAVGTTAMTDTSPRTPY